MSKGRTSRSRDTPQGKKSDTTSNVLVLSNHIESGSLLDRCVRIVQYRNSNSLLYLFC